MAITLELDDDLFAGLRERAAKERLGVEQFAIRILSEAIAIPEPLTPQEVVERIKRTPPNPAMVRRATGDLAEALRASPDDPDFDQDAWNRQWTAIEAELKAITVANDVAEGRGA